MLRLIFKLLFKLKGWTIENAFPKESQHCIMVGAPHTSNWDLVFTVASLSLLKIPMRFTIKKEWLKPPVGWFIKPLGAIGINRQKPGTGSKEGKVHEIASLFKKHERLALVITPEGTRAKSTKIKSGFYHIAKEANVPIALAYLNYRDKKAGIAKIIYPEKDFESTLQHLKDFYEKVPAKFPENNSFIGLEI